MKFSPANAKIHRLQQVGALKRYLNGRKKVYSFDLLSGWSCPFANECLAKVHQINGKAKVIDGPNTKFRCYSASQEALYPLVYKLRKANFDKCKELVKLGKEAFLNEFNKCKPKNLGILRLHTAGDFFSQDYFDCWVYVAEQNPDILFYAYTKSIPYWVSRKGNLPSNLVFTASYGGRKDDMIGEHNLRYTKVIMATKERNGLPIDSDDSHAANPKKKDKPFALLLHGIQPKGSDAAKALQKLKGKGSYSR